MMKTIVVRAAARRTSAVSRLAARAVLGSNSSWASHHRNMSTSHKFHSAHVDAPVPEEDYHKGHLMADHLEYLDDVIEKTLKLEDSMNDLHETRDRKHEIYNNVGWMESSEINQLFEDSAIQKEAAKRHMKELKQILQSAKKTFAVDSPDGMSDDTQQDEIIHVNHIIEEAALHEGKSAVLEDRKVLGVDAPDGLPDSEALQELHEVNRIIAETKDKLAVLQQRALDAANKKVIGVDAPDGESDGLQRDELRVIHDMIAQAAQQEDKAKILHKHLMQDAVRKDRVRDPEHDW